METAEQIRLREEAERLRNWKRWGPYLSERQWGTVREDYSGDGDAWRYFPHEQARSRAYRWGEDGLLGFTDRQCRLCFALALWNGQDPILKERLFGLGNHEGNHGEDVKEVYHYLDSTPTHSWSTALYRYPQRRFPYEDLVRQNQQRNRAAPEYELADTGIFEGERFFDIYIEYAKAGPDDLLIQIRAINRGPDPATLDLLPTLWFRNTWTWGCKHEGCSLKPNISRDQGGGAVTWHDTLESFRFETDDPTGGAEWLFTENETNSLLLFQTPNSGSYTKDAFHRYIVSGERDAVNPAGTGTKLAVRSRHLLGPGEEVVRRFRLRPQAAAEPAFGPEFFSTMASRKAEADEFHRVHEPTAATPDERSILRQARAGLLWSKQFYHYIVQDWLHGDTASPPPEREQKARNLDWPHMYSRDVISMPDKWEYPWFAAWDLAFHMIPFAEIDPEFAKAQMILLLREWYMHPNGQIPAYEWDFGDVNPPVHAWAAWRIYKMTGARGFRDRSFLESVFQKLLLNFTWWVNRKDPEGRSLFGGGFLGLDNIGVFDRSRPLPGGGILRQADGTAWMAFYAGTMLSMALELAKENPAYEDMASKFFEHFIQIADAINHLGGSGLWDEEDGFYYDLYKNGSEEHRLKTRSMVGLLPLIAVEVLVEEEITQLPGFSKRLDWFVRYRPDLVERISLCGTAKCGQTGSMLRILAIPSRDRLARMLNYLFDEEEFLSPYGIRSLSRYHERHPYVLRVDSKEYRVGYVPGESDSWLFGGNSNWRGPIWMPINYLLLEALERYSHFYGDDFKVEFPTRSGRFLTLKAAAREIGNRLCSLFLPDASGFRPCLGRDLFGPQDPSPLLFHEYFHADSGVGLGASHQTGWTALITRLLADRVRQRESGGML